MLLGRAERDQGRAEQFLADDADPGGRAGAGVLLVEDDLPGQGGAAAAELGGPAQAGPARRGQVPVPGQPLVVPFVLAARAAAPRSAANSPVRLASSHARTSARNSSSCGVNRTRASLGLRLAVRV